MTEEQRKEFFAMRAIMDKVVAAIPASNETEFNSSAALINENMAAVRVWKADKDYKRGAIATDPENGVPYWAMHDNGPTTGQVHQPSKSPTIWTHCHGTTPETARPFVAEGHNPYMKGHYCTENGSIYECVVHGNVYSPATYPAGWKEV